MREYIRFLHFGIQKKGHTFSAYTLCPPPRINAIHAAMPQKLLRPLSLPVRLVGIGIGFITQVALEPFSKSRAFAHSGEWWMASSAF